MLPPVARGALDHYLVQRGLPLDPATWRPSVPLLASLAGESGISPRRLWAAMKRLFATAADVAEAASPALASKLRQATPHWMRHTHATHALQRGADLATVRDNLRYASVATTSVYLHVDEQRRARQISAAFSAPER